MVLSRAHRSMSKKAIQRSELETSPWPVPLCAVNVSSLLGSGGSEMSLNACSFDAFHEVRALGVPIIVLPCMSMLTMYSAISAGIPSRTSESIWMGLLTESNARF